LALLGGTVRRRRLRHAWSQRDLQSLSGIDQGAISRLENGKLNGLRWQRFARIVDALDGLEYAAPPRERPPWPGRPTEPTNADPTTDVDD